MISPCLLLVGRSNGRRGEHLAEEPEAKESSEEKSTTKIYK